MAALVILSVAVLLGLLLPSSEADSILKGGNTLGTGESLTQGNYALTMQRDCSLQVVYQNNMALRNISDTTGKGHYCALTMETNGNLVIKDDEHPVWQTNTTGPVGKYILVLDQDTVIIYGPNITWHDGNISTINSNGGVIVGNVGIVAEVAVPAEDEPTNRKIAMVTNN